MLGRILPLLSLSLVIAALGCPRVPAPLSETPPRVAAAAAPRVVIADSSMIADAGPPDVPRTLWDEEALPRETVDVSEGKVVAARWMEEKRPHDAVTVLRTLLSVDPSAEVWQRLGEAHIAAGDDARGVRCLEEAVARDPTADQARKALVKHYLAHDDARARGHADELVRQRPTDAASRQLLGRAQMQQKMWKEAIATFELVVATEPENIFAHNNIGYSALQVGSLELAREHLERCLGLEPQQGYMLNNLGVAYERLGLDAEAHAAFSRAAELSPRYVQAKLNRDRVQTGLTQEEQVASAEALLQMRNPPRPVDDPVDAPADARGGASAAVAPVDAVRDTVDAYTGGSARLAPAPVDEPGR